MRQFMVPRLFLYYCFLTVRFFPFSPGPPFRIKFVTNVSHRFGVCSPVVFPSFPVHHSVVFQFAAVPGVPRGQLTLPNFCPFLHFYGRAPSLLFFFPGCLWSLLLYPNTPVFRLRTFFLLIRQSLTFPNSPGLHPFFQHPLLTFFAAPWRRLLLSLYTLQPCIAPTEFQPSISHRHSNGPRLVRPP